MPRFVDVLEIPLTARPQLGTVWLGDKEYRMRTYWLWPAQCWVVDIADNMGNPIINGVPLVTGADLIEQFQYTGVLGRMIVMSTDRPPATVPGWGDLGVTGHVYWRRR